MPRHPRIARIEYVIALGKATTFKERIAIAEHGNMEACKNQTRLKEAYDECVVAWHKVTAYLKTPEGQKNRSKLTQPRKRQAKAPAPAPAPPAPAAQQAHDGSDSDADYATPASYASADEAPSRRSNSSSGDSDSSGSIGTDAAAASESAAPQPPDAAAASSSGGAPSATAAQTAAQAAEEAAMKADQTLRNSIKEAAKRTFVRWIRTSSVDDTPRKVGARLEKNRPVLAQIKVLLEEGWIDKQNKRRIFRSLDELEAYDKRKHAEAAANGVELGVPSYDSLKKKLSKRPSGLSNRTIDKQLKAAFGLRKRKQRMRRARKFKDVQVCTCKAAELLLCLQVLGACVMQWRSDAGTHA